MSRFSAIDEYGPEMPVDEEERFEPTEMPRWLRSTCLVCGIVGVTFFVFQKDYVTATLIGLIPLSALSGFRIGASRITASLLGFWLAYSCAPPLASRYEYTFSGMVGTTGLVNRWTCIAVFAILISLVVFLVSCKLITLLLRGRQRLCVIDHSVGMALGGAEVVAAALIFLGGVVFFEPAIRQVRIRAVAEGDSSGNRAALSEGDWFMNLAENIRVSNVSSTVESLNPFTRIESLKKYEKTHQTVDVLANPRNLDKLMHHPAITALTKDPDFKRLFENLEKDPEIQTILQSRQALTGADVWQLLSHPAVQDLVDQDDFMERASDLIQQQVDYIERHSQN